MNPIIKWFGLLFMDRWCRVLYTQDINEPSRKSYKEGTIRIITMCAHANIALIVSVISVVALIVRKILALL